MALRVSIGAGRLRLVQLVLVESAMMAMFASLLGASFAWWSAPLVVSMINPADDPARLILPADWRVLGFGLLLIFAVVLLFGVAPAFRASTVKPVSALKGGDDPHGRRRRMYGMIGTQVAFCFVVVFIAGLFMTTFQRLAHKPLGFEPKNLLLLDTVAQREQPAVVWDEAANSLRGMAGVQDVALSGDALLGGNSWNNFISINGAPPGPILSYFLTVSPNWMRSMRISFVKGRDFRDGDATPGAAIVNETFAKTYFHGEDPVGKTFVRTEWQARYQIVGMVRDAPYRSLREPTLPVAFVPMHEMNATGVLKGVSGGTFVVRTTGANPTALASLLRQRLKQEHPELRVSNIRTQMELVRDQTLRERLLAMLAAFFAAVALLLAGIGLYGVLHYSVLQRQREIGIRIALGARIANIARLITSEIFVTVITGGIAGVVLGLMAAKYLRSLLYGVKGDDPVMLLLPAMVLLTAALLSALPAVLRAARIDPAKMLRAE
jgi:predicted permease